LVLLLHALQIQSRSTILQDKNENLYKTSRLFQLNDSTFQINSKISLCHVLRDAQCIVNIGVLI
jgi:hypothetical protein